MKLFNFSILLLTITNYGFAGIFSKHYPDGYINSMPSSRHVRYCWDKRDPWIAANIAKCELEQIQDRNKANEVLKSLGGEASAIYCSIKDNPSQKSSIVSDIEELISFDNKACDLLKEDLKRPILGGLSGKIYQKACSNNLSELPGNKETISMRTRKNMQEILSLAKTCPGVIQRPKDSTGKPHFDLADVRHMLCKDLTKINDFSNSGIYNKAETVHHTDMARQKFMLAMSAIRMHAAGCSGVYFSRQSKKYIDIDKSQIQGSTYITKWYQYITGSNVMHARGAQAIENAFKERFDAGMSSGYRKLQKAFNLSAEMTNKVVDQEIKDALDNPYERWSYNGGSHQDLAYFYKVQENIDNGVDCNQGI